MKKMISLYHTASVVVLLAGLLSLPAAAAETTASVEQLEAALKKSNEALAAT